MNFSTKTGAILTGAIRIDKRRMGILLRSSALFITIFGLGLVSIPMLKAQAVGGAAGGAAVPFITIGPDARASGMGDLGTGVADDLNAIHWNPAGLAFQYDRQIGLSFSSWLPQFNAGLSYNRLNYAQYWSAIQGTFAVDILVFNLGEFIRTDVNGRETGRFRSFEYTINAAYATQLNDDLGIGLGVKYIESNLGESASAGGGGIGRTGALDVSLLYKPLKLKIADMDLSDRFSLGVNLRNIGPSVTYNQFADPLPTQMRFGLATTFVRDEYNDLKFAADFTKLLVNRRTDGTFDAVPVNLITGWATPSFELAGGLEYWYDRTIALRTGYYFEPNQVGNRNYFTMGFGVRFDIFEFNGSYIIPTQTNHPLANTLRVSLIVNFKNGKELLGIQKPSK
jgi:Type IX secretion system protein PorV